jgi:hypothetical protein
MNPEYCASGSCNGLGATRGLRFFVEGVRFAFPGPGLPGENGPLAP